VAIDKLGKKLPQSLTRETKAEVLLLSFPPPLKVTIKIKLSKFGACTRRGISVTNQKFLQILVITKRKIG
jgi:hypothetical protein